MRHRAHSFLRKRRTPLGRMDYFAFYAVLLRLCLCEAFYLPALRATFLSKKARQVSLRDNLRIRVPSPAPTGHPPPIRRVYDVAAPPHL